MRSCITVAIQHLLEPGKQLVVVISVRKPRLPRLIPRIGTSRSSSKRATLNKVLAAQHHHKIHEVWYGGARIAGGFADRRRRIRIEQYVNVTLREPGQETMQQLRDNLAHAVSR